MTIAGEVMTCLVAGLIGASLVLLAQHLVGKFHVVCVGDLYRSGQLSPGQLRRLSKRHHIRSIVNLRGSNPGKLWYDREVAVARELGIDHIDFAMSAGKILTEERVEELLRIFKDAPRPILVHCGGGSERTGLASAIYVSRILQADRGLAAFQLSPLFGYIGIPRLMRACAMRRSWSALGD